MAMSKHCIPYTPPMLDHSNSTFALVSTAGVHLKEQEPYNVEGDNTWRLIAGDVQASQLMVTHEHYDHHDADQDINTSAREEVLSVRAPTRSGHRRDRQSDGIESYVNRPYSLCDMGQVAYCLVV